MARPKSLALALLAMSWLALGAHTPYVKPSVFETAGAGPVTAEAAYSTDIFTGVVGFPLENMALINPAGERIGFDRVEVRPDATRLEATLAQEGTYRLTTGERIGAPAQMVLDGRQWRPVAPGERLRRGARRSSLQMVTLAESYVTRGQANRTAVDLIEGRLAIHPITHPDLVTVASGLDVELLFDEAPFAFMPFVLYRPGQSEDEMRRVFVTDVNGRAHISFTDPGVYLAVVRYRTPAPAGSRAAVYSYSTTICFEVTGEPAPARPE